MSKKNKPRYLYEESKLCPKCKIPPDHFTLVFCFSRAWAVYPIFESLKAMKIPIDKCHLLLYDNTENALLQRALEQKIKLYKGVFASMRYYKSYRQGGRVILGMRKYKFEQTKLPAIWEMYEELPEHIKTDFFISIEDDTYCPPNTIMRLLEGFEEYNHRAFISGVEPSRHYNRLAIPLIGVYKIKEEDGRIVEKLSLSPKRYYRIRVHATGHYCFITTKEIWKEGWKFNKRDYDHIKHLAMDVFHTYHLHKKGIPIIADFKIRCKHMQIDPRGIVYWKVSQAMPALDFYIKKYNKWAAFIKLEKELKGF